MDGKAAHLFIDRFVVTAFCTQARGAVFELMLDARAVLYVLIVPHEARTPAREPPGAVSEIEHSAQGFMIRTEVQDHTVVVQSESQDAPYHGESFFLVRCIVARGVRERTVLITNR